jgi:hypothetical protein
VTAAFCVAAGTAARAGAQTWPAADEWYPLPCGVDAKIKTMTDPYRDQSGAIDARDLVGDVGAPAGFFANDGKFLYFRLRLDKSPLAANSKLRPHAWGIAVSTDTDQSTYELLIMVNGNASKVELYRNTTTTITNDPKDPADKPPVNSYAFTTHGRVEAAPQSAYGGDEDHFLDFTVPWSALGAVGLKQGTRSRVWAGSSSTPGTLNGDIACHDGTGGAPRLLVTGGVSTVLDPDLDTDGDGFTDRVEVEAGTNPSDASSKPAGDPPGPGPGGVDLEGGGGCALLPGTAEAAPPPLAPLGLAPLALLALLYWRERASKSRA